MAHDFRLLGFITGALGGSQIFQPANNQDTGNNLQVISNRTLSTGDNTFTPPGGSVAFIFLPPPGNLTTIELRKTGGVTGWRLHMTWWTFLPLDNSLLSDIILNVTANISGCTIAWVL